MMLIYLAYRFCKSSKLDVEDTQYELFAIIVHKGSLE